MSSGLHELIEQDINFCIRVKKLHCHLNHLGKNHKISDLFRHLKVGQIECRKRRILVGRVKLYISALHVRKWRAFTRRFSSV